MPDGPSSGRRSADIADVCDISGRLAHRRFRLPASLADKIPIPAGGGTRTFGVCSGFLRHPSTALRPIESCRSSPMTLRALSLICAALAFTVTGCHSPKGGAMPYTGGSHTYFSTPSAPKTLTLVDIRSGDVIWQMDIPVGKQLTIDFDAGKGDDSVYTPDLMRWEVFDLGTEYGSLSNSMTVPSIRALRMDVDVRPTMEYAPDDHEQALRTDQMLDRPDYWTSQGGPAPEDSRGIRTYDN
jgi:hypothetical protein